MSAMHTKFAALDTLDDELVIFFGSDIKAADEGIGEGLLVPFDVTDSHNEYFQKSTFYGLYNATERRPLFYDHGLNRTYKRTVIGYVDLTATEAGIHAKAQFDLSIPLGQAAWAECKAGKLGYSSGTNRTTMDRGAMVPGKGTPITQWLIAEASATPTPAAGRAARLTAIKSLSEYAADSEGEPETKAYLSEDGKDQSISSALWHLADLLTTPRAFLNIPKIQEFIRNLADRVATDLKSGRRNSDSDMKKLREMHDLAVGLGADNCGTDKKCGCQEGENKKPMANAPSPAAPATESATTAQLANLLNEITSLKADLLTAQTSATALTTELAELKAAHQLLLEQREADLALFKLMTPTQK